MAFGLFKKAGAAPPPPAPEPKPAVVADVAGGVPDSAREILELLELELGGMIRQIERAANQVAGGAQSTAATLTTIRERADALTARASTAQDTATTFVRAARTSLNRRTESSNRCVTPAGSPTRPAPPRARPA